MFLCNFIPIILIIKYTNTSNYSNNYTINFYDSKNAISSQINFLGSVKELVPFLSNYFAHHTWNCNIYNTQKCGKIGTRVHRWCIDIHLHKC
jgi:hypothetical protein